MSGRGRSSNSSRGSNSYNRSSGSVLGILIEKTIEAETLIEEIIIIVIHRVVKWNVFHIILVSNRWLQMIQ